MLAPLTVSHIRQITTAFSNSFTVSVIVMQTPVPGAYCQGLDEKAMSRTLSAYMIRFSWVRLYAALLGSVPLLRGPKPANTVLDM